MRALASKLVRLVGELSRRIDDFYVQEKERLIYWQTQVQEDRATEASIRLGTATKLRADGIAWHGLGMPRRVSFGTTRLYGRLQRRALGDLGSVISLAGDSLLVLDRDSVPYDTSVVPFHRYPEARSDCRKE